MTQILTIELVPASMWTKNVRAIIARNTWDALRWSLGATIHKPSFRKGSLNLPEPPWDIPITCKICGAKEDSLDLHEVWTFDDENMIQKLVELIPICSSCHMVKHLGRASQLGRYDEAIKHLAHVNQWSIKQAEQYASSAFDIWARRSRYTYTLDFSLLKQWLPSTKIHLNWLYDNQRWVGDRLAAIQWARDILKTDALVLDTETTGLLDKKNVEAIQIAVITMQGKVLYDQLLKPKYKIPKRVIKIHGITNESVAESPTFKDEYETLSELLNGRTIITYNTRFDSGILDRTCYLWKLPVISSKLICAMHIYRVFMESGKWLKLPEAQHTALDDCNATLALIKAMANAH